MIELHGDAEPTPEQLRKLLPPRPSERQPNLLRAWLRMFRSPFDLVAARAQRAERAFTSQQLSLRAPVATTRILSSGNWSGASIVPHDGQRFVLLFGSWTVPTPALPPNPDQRISAGKYLSSTWIGFDGARNYTDSSLPQIGTEQWLEVSASGALTPGYDAFFQWWSKLDPNPKLSFFHLTGIKITAGMPVMAMLWAYDPVHVVGALRTFGPQGQLVVFPGTAPQFQIKGIPLQPRSSGAMAEWIVERPRDDDKALLPFPDYGTASFADCVAGTAPRPGLPTGEAVLRAPRLLRMFESPPSNPSRTRMISHAHRTGATEIDIRYGPIP